MRDLIAAFKKSNKSGNGKGIELVIHSTKNQFIQQPSPHIKTIIIPISQLFFFFQFFSILFYSCPFLFPPILDLYLQKLPTFYNVSSN